MRPCGLGIPLCLDILYLKNMKESFKLTILVLNISKMQNY